MTYAEGSYLVESLKSCRLRNGSRKQVYLARKTEDFGERMGCEHGKKHDDPWFNRSMF